MGVLLSLRSGNKLSLAGLVITCVFLLALPRGAGAAREYPEGCTTITVGRSASTDGSVMTSHTCDGHDGRTWLDIIPARKHSSGAWTPVYSNTDFMTVPFDTSGMKYTGSLPLPSETFAYIYAIYPPMNQHQLAIGESTFGGKEELKSDKGMINCYELTRIMAARCQTARGAIKLAGKLLDKYGYNDGGECLTIADTKEVWHLEIVGPGQGKVGAIWAAQRVPDDHISVNANGSRIRQIDIKNKDFFLASRNVFSAAEEMGYWDPRGGQPFEFCYAYASRKSMWARRREWRVLDLVAPSLELDPNGENFPFSVKPEKKVSVADMQKLFADTYEDTEYDMTKFMLITDEDGKRVKSPYANPFMNYDQMPLWKINGGLGLYGERTIARYYCIYVFITQSRDWLPDPVGGVVWLGWDNPAMTCYVPLYCGITRVPDSYRMGGKGGRPAYSRDSAWWGVNRVSTIAAHRWGDMRNDVAAVRDPLHENLFAEQKRVEDEALRLLAEDPAQAVEYLTKYSNDWCVKIDRAYWKLGDDLWTKYDEKF